MKYFISLIFLCIASLTLAQPTSDTTVNPILTGVINLRKELLAKRAHLAEELNMLCKDILATDIEKKKLLIAFIKQAIYSPKYTIYNEEAVIGLFERKRNRVSILNRLKNIETRVEPINRIINDLIRLKILKGRSPFMIIDSDNICEEITLYDISKGDKIGEIGAGRGDISLIIASF